MPQRPFLEPLDDEHHDYESVLEFAEFSLAAPFQDAGSAQETLTELRNGLNDLENLEEAPSVNAVRDLVKMADKIEDELSSIVWSSFEKCMVMAAQCYPTLQPPFEDWMEDRSWGARNNGIPYGGRAFDVLLRAFPLNALLPVLSDYFVEKKYPKHAASLHEHTQILLDVASNQIRNSQSVGGDDASKASAWLYVLTERVFSAHSPKLVHEDAKLPSLFFRHGRSKEHFLPFILGRWPTFSNEQLSCIRQTIGSGPSGYGTAKKERLVEFSELPWHTWELSFGDSARQIRGVLHELIQSSLTPEEQQDVQRTLLKHSLLEKPSQKQEKLAL